MSRPQSPSSPESSNQPDKCVLVCQNRTCLKQGGAAILTALRARPVDGYNVIGTGCMGQCGSGPMVRIVPGDIWYSRVSPAEVPALIEQHLRSGRVIKAMLYPKFHARSPRHS